MKIRKALLALAAFGTVINACAAVSPDEARQLGSSNLTPWGSEKAGNKEGTIPPYTGERPKVPAAYDPKDPGIMPDPYADEKPLYSITAQNMDKYADKLSDGQREALRRYPNNRMDVYPTHRTAAFAPYVIENTVKNATSCKAADNGLRLEGCYGGIPFPIPKSGHEAVWNKVMVSPTHFWAGKTKTYMVDTNGKPVLQSVISIVQEALNFDPANKGIMSNDAPYWRMWISSEGPARKIGEKYLFVYYLDQVNKGTRVWSYIPGQRRVKLAPDLSYDTPSPVSGGAATMDQSRLFLGPQDRYDMKLVGKREIYMLYNNYRLTDYRACPAEKTLNNKGFANPDCLRWELHRAWAVQGTLKPGFRHILPKRMFYFDEDSWVAGVADSWDAAGKIFRLDNTPHWAYYYEPYGQVSDGNLTSDFQTGILYFSAAVAFPGGNFRPIKPVPNREAFFSPETLAAEGIR